MRGGFAGPCPALRALVASWQPLVCALSPWEMHMGAGQVLEQDDAAGSHWPEAAGKLQGSLKQVGGTDLRIF